MYYVAKRVAMVNLKRIDFYRRVPVDLTEPTAPGAIISIVAGVFMTALFVGEVWSYVSPPQRTDMFVAQDQDGSKLKVNFDMSFHKLPCFAMSFDVLDALGRHEMGMSGAVHKERLGTDGKRIGEWQSSNDMEMGQQSSEGCRVFGHVFVNKVPGNFHVSAHGLQHLVMRFMGGHMNVQHTIHHLWIGDVEFHGDHGYEGQLHPINGLAQLDEQTMHYEYHLDIVPTIFGAGSAKKAPEERSYQLAIAKHKQELPPGNMPAAFFRYQLSPITVRFDRERVSFIHFLTYVCAIVGGVYSVAGIVNGMVHRAAVQLQRRLLGKDS